MIYLSHFSFPSVDEEDDFFFSLRRTCYNSYYPFRIISKHHLQMLDFEPITILYGDNGSGKTTVLNVIAEKLGLERDTLYNRSSFFKHIRICVLIRQTITYQTKAELLPVMMFLILC